MKARNISGAFVHGSLAAAMVLGAGSLAIPLEAQADATCNSPFMSNLVKDEQYVYVWTLGVKGMGDGSDKLVTIDVNPKSKKFGKVIATLSVGGRGEAHHMGFTDDHHHMWAGRLDDNKIFIFDIYTNPAQPKLVKTISDFAQTTGYVGPHTFYALPGRMLVGALSNTKDHGGVTGLAVYNNKGEFVSKHDMPTGEMNGVRADGYGYDIGINPQKNTMLTTSFTGWNNYMMDFGKLLKDQEAMKHFGETVVAWDVKTMKPTKVMHVPGSPLEIRWSLASGDNWAVTANATTSAMWVFKEDDKGEWQAHNVATIGNPAELPLPVDISMRADGKGLWIDTMGDGSARYWDMTDPMHPKEVYKKKIGAQVNMVSQSWDGSRLYFTSSLLANWDKKGKDNEQYFAAYDWNGKELTERFRIDFAALKLGRAHHMKFGSDALRPGYAAQRQWTDAPASRVASARLVSNGQ
ncbi:MAG: selenium-binding protein [Comamonadaceae bacterium]|nr:selenium-binding family protein [Burkholderiales bacterium]MEB2347127.1 selenium-binding protein [Comamonadaceae bacterium]